VGRPEDRKGYGLGAEDRAGQGGGVESCSYTERSWHYDSAVVVTDRNHPTRNVRVVGARAPYVLGKRVMNVWNRNRGSYEKEMEKGYVELSTVNPKLSEDVGYVDEALGLGELG
jgi:hypothetical protein